LRLNISTPRCWRRCTRPTWPTSSEELKPEDRETLIRSLAPEAAAETAVGGESDIQTKIFEFARFGEGCPRFSRRWLRTKRPTCSSELARRMVGGRFCTRCRAKRRLDVEDLLEYAEDTAGGLNDDRLPGRSGRIRRWARRWRRCGRIRKLAENGLTRVFLIDATERSHGAVTLPQLTPGAAGDA